MTVSDVPVSARPSFEGETFMRWMIRDIAGVLQDVVGDAEAEGYVSVVGDRMGERLDDLYSQGRTRGPWSTTELSEVLVDLKHQIGGEFSVAEVTDDQIVFTNSRCPFGDAVLDRPSLCMMTSNVFGRIGANHLGRVSVTLDETIAAGDGRCIVRVGLGAGDSTNGSRNYYAE